MDLFLSSNRTYFAAVEQQDKSHCPGLLKAEQYKTQGDRHASENNR
jgi:hypothetical protein